MTEHSARKSVESISADEVGRLVVDQGLATEEEIAACIQAAADAGHCSFAAVLVQKGVVTQGQIGRLKTSIEDARKQQQIPGHHIICKLGAGAMATVYKARQLSLDRLVAIKVLPKALSENAEYVDRFYKEGKAAAKLNHPNIVQAYDVGEAGGYHYFVMEYVEGHTLHDELAKGEAFPEEEALRLVIQVARALEHAHAQGLIHRDVKPKNIMMAPGGIAKLADMGLARAASDQEAAQAEAGRAYGTPYYISPEQIRGEVDIDFRADIYSLGATLYHLVTGRVPFEGSNPMEVMHKHLKAQLVPPDHVNTALSAGIGEVVERMMAKDRRERYASTSDLLLDLQAIAAGAPPLQARKGINENLLSGLVADAEARDALPGDAAGRGRRRAARVILLLAAALALSVLLNIVLLVLRAGS